MEIRGNRLLRWPFRQLGSCETIWISDWAFDWDSNMMTALKIQSDWIRIESIVFRQGQLILCEKMHQAKTEYLNGWQSYQNFLHAEICDELGDTVGVVGEVIVDLVDRKVKAVELSSGVIVDLYHGRKRVEMVHIKEMLIEQRKEGEG